MLNPPNFQHTLYQAFMPCTRSVFWLIHKITLCIIVSGVLTIASSEISAACCDALGVLWLWLIQSDQHGGVHWSTLHGSLPGTLWALWGRARGGRGTCWPSGWRDSCWEEGTLSTTLTHPTPPRHHSTYPLTLLPATTQGIGSTP